MLPGHNLINTTGPDPEHKSNIMISWSDDKGVNWSPAKRINQKSGDCKDDDKTTEGAVPAVGPNGEVYVAWAWKNKIYFDRSEDGGKTWLEKDIKGSQTTWRLGTIRPRTIPLQRHAHHLMR